MDLNIISLIIAATALVVGIVAGKFIFAKDTRKRVEEAELSCEWGTDPPAFSYRCDGHFWNVLPVGSRLVSLHRELEQSVSTFSSQRDEGGPCAIDERHRLLSNRYVRLEETRTTFPS